MSLFDIFKKKYNKNPKDNTPRMIYGTPDAMRRRERKLKDKYNQDPKENMPRMVYGVPKPDKFD